MRRSAAPWCALLTAACWALAAPAAAYEDQASLDVSLGGSLWTSEPPFEGAGGAASLGASWGAGDLFNLRASALYDLGVPDFPHRVGLRAEAAYLIDVVQVVPFVGVGGSAGLGFGDGELALGGHLLFGLDYLVNRLWNVGVDVRTGAALTGDSSGATFGVDLRISRLFDLF